MAMKDRAGKKSSVPQEHAMRLFLVRHGETAANKQMRYLGVRDDPLTENGFRQATQVASVLAQLPIRAIYASPLSRASVTAAEIQKACGAELRLDARLAECSFGSWEGLSRAEVLKLGKEHSEILKRWEVDPSCTPPGGESMESVQERMCGMMEELQGVFLNSSVVIVSHVGPIKALLAVALGMTLQASRRLFLDPCTISVVDWGTPPLLRLFNSHAHMGWLSARWMLASAP